MGVEPGKYAIRGHATLNIDREYDYMSEDFNYYVDYKRSDYSQVEAIYQGPVTSSTNIEAGMTNEEVRDAIEQGKPLLEFQKLLGRKMQMQLEQTRYRQAT